MRVGRLIFQFGVIMLLVCIMLMPGVSWGAFDAFLKIDGIEGESTDDKHSNWIEVHSFSGPEIREAGDSSTTPGWITSGEFYTGAYSDVKMEFSGFTIIKAVDKATPKLYQAAARKTHIKEVILELCRAGGDKVKYMEYKLGNCTVSSVKVEGKSGGNETLPLEAVTFKFETIQWIYTKQKNADGGGGGQTATGWDLAKNKPI